MKLELIEFNAIDGVKLNGYINRETNNNKNLLIEIHGMTSNCFKDREKIIANEVEKLGFDTICINTRGSEISRYIKYEDGKKELAGTAYEDVEDSYYDILGVLKYAIELGYKSIYLQGHSLGATKVIYTYLKMKESKCIETQYIKGILLLSLVDLTYIFDAYSDKKFDKYAEEKESNGENLILMPCEAFIHPISVKTYLRYTKYNKNINFAQFSKENNEFREINKIDVPIFMRWGDTKELIKDGADKQVELMKNKIKNVQKDIDYIIGADHTYTNKEIELANQIAIFLNRHK